MDNYYLLDTNAKLQTLNESLQEIVEAINNLTNCLRCSRFN